MRRFLLLLALLPAVAHADIVGHVVAPTGVIIQMSDVVGICPVGVGMNTFIEQNDIGQPISAGCWSKESGGFRFYPYDRAAYDVPFSYFKKGRYVFPKAYN